MSELFRKAKNQFQQQLPFVIYCKPNSEKTIALFQENDDLYLLDQTDESGFVFVSFDNEQRFIIPDVASSIYFEKNNTLDYFVSNENEIVIDDESKIAFEKLVEKAVTTIHHNDFEKVVLSRKETILAPNFDFESTFKKLLSNYKTAFKYCFYHPRVGFWMGATPEQFIKINAKKLSTVSLAGTQLHNGKSDITWSNKEVEEQKIVTDYIVSNLNKYSKQVSKSQPYTVQAGNLAHIKTDIEAELITDKDSAEIIAALHPTPAVCGFPKDKAKTFILENEKYNREFYAGFLGEWNKDFSTYAQHQSDLFVNLRCMKINHNAIDIFVGCGITKDSNPEKEFLETVNKSTTMRKIL